MKCGKPWNFEAEEWLELSRLKEDNSIKDDTPKPDEVGNTEPERGDESLGD